MALSPERVGGAEPLRQRREPFGPKVHSCTINREQRHYREEGAVMKRLIKPVSWLGAVAGVLLLAGAVAAPSRTPAAPGAPPPPEVTVITVAPQTDVDQAQAAFDQAKKDYDDTFVRAEIAGRAGRALLELGGRVTGPGDLLTTVEQVDPIYVNFSPSDQDVLRWRRDAADGRLVMPRGALTVQVTLADGTVYPRIGTLNFTDLALQPVTGTQQLRAELKNPQHLLLPGQFVRVRLLGLKLPGAFLVPQRAVLQGLGGAFVYVLDAGDKVATRNVIATSWDGGSWLIEQGLAAGDGVVVDGVQQVAPGSPVRAVAYQPAADTAAARSTP